VASRPLAEALFFLWRCRQSVTLGLLCLVSLAAALPILVYLHFDRIDAQRLGQVHDSLADRDRLVAAALAPTLVASDDPDDKAVGIALAGLTASATHRWLLFIPADEVRNGGIRVRELESPEGATPLDNESDGARPFKVLRDMPASCIPAESSGKSHVMVSSGYRFTSIVPIPAMRGCWLLISQDPRAESFSALTSSAFAQLWDTRLLIVAYVLAVGIAVLSAIMIGAGLRRFRTIAYDIGQYRMPLGSHGDGKVMPELSGAAEVLDGLALDIRRISGQIRQTAEDDAHSLKTPLAVVRAAVGRIRRHVPDDSAAVQYALAAADQAVDRLFLLITTSQRLDEDTAALIVSPRQLIDFTELIEETARQFSDLVAVRHIKCVLRLPLGVMVRAGIGHLEPVLRNVVDNAVSSLPEHGLLVLSLSRNSRTIDLRVEDNGEGVAADAVDRLFERDYSTPDSEVDESDNSPRHARPGLFIVKRNVEALGGHVAAENIPSGGFAITITLPRPRR
jgi:two-component system, OmpR family, sensor histidine kinase ChvG